MASSSINFNSINSKQIDILVPVVLSIRYLKPYFVLYLQHFCRTSKILNHIPNNDVIYVNTKHNKLVSSEKFLHNVMDSLVDVAARPDRAVATRPW